ncbi:restriction endonuclease [Wukongibacter sp. M2B1]|uniref:restriction endonuclease n=1 Tax=Wukongibacter sp. M2B1 TaxID=3088895 RepID=UPI003D7A8894
MLNFKELGRDGVKFEKLIRELLLSEGLEVHWTGVGPDGDKDLIVIESYDGLLSTIKRKWVVQCKHNAHSGKSVSKGDLNIMETCLAVDATGYLLVCSTQPTSGLIRHFEEINNTRGLEIKYWDSIEIEKRLMKPNNYHLVDVFFEESSKKVGWKLLNTQDSSFWMAYFKRYFIYLSSRDSLTFSNLKFVEKIIETIEGFNAIDKRELVGMERWTNHREYLMPRAVYYDDKNTNFTVFLDYMFYSGTKPKARVVDFRKYFTEKNCNIDGVSVEWDILFVQANFSSDHFRINHKDYYRRYIDSFKIGYSREESFTNYEYEDYNYIEKLIIDYELTELKENIGYERFFNEYQNDIIGCLKSEYGGSALIEKVLDHFRLNNDFDNDDVYKNVWQIFCLNSIEELRAKEIIISKETSPKGVIILSEKGKRMCDFYNTSLRKM